MFSNTLRLALVALCGVVFSAGSRAQCSGSTNVRASVPGNGDRFGAAVAVDGDTVVVGASKRDTGGLPNSGAVHVFVQDAAVPWTWDQFVRLEAANAAAVDRFGDAVAISGDVVAVGAPGADRAGADSGADSGAVYVFARNQGGANAWGQVVELTASDGSAAARFGTSVALDGDTLAVGATVGAAYLFERNQGGANAWGEVTKLVPSHPASEVGRAVALDGDEVVVGGVHATAAVGGATLFGRNQGGANVWGEIVTVFGSEVSFARSVAIHADNLLIGAPEDGDGLAFLYGRNQGGPGAWGAVQTLTGTAGVLAVGDFGTSVAARSDLLLVGAPFSVLFFPNLERGAVHVFRRGWGAGGTWGVFTYHSPSGPATAEFGASVAMSSDTYVMGSPTSTGPLGVTGSARIHHAAAGVAPTSYCTAGTSANACEPFLDAWGNLYVEVHDAEGDRKGLFYFGVNGAQASPWGNGTSLQCVVPPVTRTGFVTLSGQKNTCSGFASLDFYNWLALNPSKAPGTGQQIWMQFWYRDPQNPSNQTTSLSDGITFTVCPGQGQ